MNRKEIINYLIKKHDPCDGDFFPTKEEQNFHKKCVKNVYTDEMKEIIESLSSLEQKIIDSFDNQLVNLKTEEVVDFTDFIERKTKNITKVFYHGDISYLYKINNKYLTFYVDESNVSKLENYKHENNLSYSVYSLDIYHDEDI